MPSRSEPRRVAFLVAERSVRCGRAVADDFVDDSLCWKTHALVTHAAGRPFVWLDDEPTAADDAYVAAHHAGPALLHRTDPMLGLTAADFDAVKTWLLGIS